MERKITSLHWFLLGVSLIAVGAVLGLHTEKAEATRSDITLSPSISSMPHFSLDQENSITISLPLPQGEIHSSMGITANEDPSSWLLVEVKKGDNLSNIFQRLKIDPLQLHDILSIGEDVTTLKHLLPGETLKLRIGPSNRLTGLIYEMDPTHQLHIQATENGFKADSIHLPIERRIAHATGAIDSSLFVSAQRAGMSDKLTMTLAGIFGWDIDFALDIRQGDSFSVLYEEEYLKGKKISDGDIVAAEFSNRGNIYRAVLFTDENGRSDYFTPEGMSMRKAFLRTPVEFSRISSRFSTGRKHPILHHIRAHKGVDYASPAGTPVKATGDGTVTFRGVKGGYGKVLVLQHGTRYSTLYAHLSRYARGIHEGNRVQQGQIIGYVGMTGLATGPHLHYEFRVDSRHRDPLTVKFPDAAPIPDRYKSDFLTQTRPKLAQLNLLNASGKLALNIE